MSPEQFCYWLQGRAELEPAPPTAEQWQSICDHLSTVFDKVTPPLGTFDRKPDAEAFLDRAFETLEEPVTRRRERHRERRARCSSDVLTTRLC